jgi:hypothetical protein
MRMRAIIGTGVAGVVVAAGAVLVPMAASAQPAAPTAAKVHTYNFTQITHKQVSPTQTNGLVADDDVNAKGKAIGFDLIYATFNPKNSVLSGYFTVILPGGMIYATFSGNPSDHVYKGAITGGAGAFKHAKGTLYAKDLNAAGTKSAVSLKYTL